MSDAALICYGVVDAADVPKGRAGLRGALLRPVSSGSLALLTSALAADAFAGASQTQVEEAAQDFHAVINAWSAQRNILPMRFGTLFDGEAAALRYLARQGGALTAAFAGISGMQEWRVAVRHAGGEKPAPAKAQPGYLRALQAKRRQEKQEQDDVTRQLEALAGVLQDHGAVLCDCVLDAKGSGTLTTLWPRGQAGAFMHHMSTYADQSGAISFDVFGPEAPFTFAAQGLPAHAA
ncbi:MAG: GvpL/GvpF family gas vesicle protein [Pseudomonadota bacterium]